MQVHVLHTHMYMNMEKERDKHIMLNKVELCWIQSPVARSASEPDLNLQSRRSGNIALSSQWRRVGDHKLGGFMLLVNHLEAVEPVTSHSNSAPPPGPGRKRWVECPISRSTMPLLSEWRRLWNLLGQSCFQILMRNYKKIHLVWHLGHWFNVISTSGELATKMRFLEAIVTIEQF